MSFFRLLPITLLFSAVLLSGSVARASDADVAVESATYQSLVQADGPIAYWRFDGERPLVGAGEAFAGAPIGAVDAQYAGPRPDEYPLFDENNASLLLRGGGYVRIADDQRGSLKFRQGDTITLEAWVNPTTLRNDQNVYVVGKGRTGLPGAQADNQNYALRLRGLGDTVRVSFLFRSAAGKGKPGGWHRWNSDRGFVIGSGWQHIAVSYTFGDPKSIRGYLNGEQVTGTWDMDGPSDRPPVADDDEVWIGSALGGSVSNSFVGGIDEAAIHRAVISPERMAKRYARQDATASYEPTDPPEGLVQAEIVEFFPDKWTWDHRFSTPTEHFFEKSFALVDLLPRYNHEGLRVDRSNPLLLRLTADVVIPEGEQRLLVRSRGGARLFVDDKLVLTTPFPRGLSDGHYKLYSSEAEGAPHIAGLWPGDRQEIASIAGDGQKRRLRLEVFVGGQNRRPEVGNLLMALAAPGEDFKIISPAGEEIPLTDAGWAEFAERYRAELIERSAERRRAADTAGAARWTKRHERARAYARQLPEPALPEVKNLDTVNNEIDRFIAAKLEEANRMPGPLVDDWGFLRRVSLDVRGLPPTPAETVQFFADKSPNRRAKFIDRMLADPAWADRWVGYWQEVLAENPNIVNPTLNNTGPFRWWIYESFLDNKPLDRFASELIEMQGSKHFGGPAGFELATENDVPMAAKAHIVGEAFLGVNMSCARCHDAPNHDILQEDLFAMAAMLKRAPEGVPKTSTIDSTPEELAALAVQVTLKPGSKVAPKWPFTDLIDAETLASNASDSRSQLAALVTSPQNKRFAPVMVNRLWQRLTGLGLVNSVHDWEGARASHPELLDWLARDFMLHGYDFKHSARRILNSQTYQRAPAAQEQTYAQQRLFAYAVPRRLEAEQVVDSLYAAVGKSFNVEEQNIDTDTARPLTRSLNLGHPRRAWHFTSTSNERDRPSLALPASQSILAILENFGWRASRQNPVSLREAEPSVLQSAILANGAAARRAITISDDGALVELALNAPTVEQLVDDIYIRLLCRLPDEEERATFAELLREGFAERKTGQPALAPPPRPINLVAWTNHLDPEANTFKKEMEELVEAGDPPSPRLAADWRQRLTDMVWALVNSPEFVVVP